jgi:hypothetical protein
MKAAVLHTLGGIPKYEEFPEPVPGDDQELIHVKAVSLENVDKAMALNNSFQISPPSSALMVSEHCRMGNLSALAVSSPPTARWQKGPWCQRHIPFPFLTV